jgi:hypothetical protein
MLDAKLVGDLITASRGILGLIIVWFGLTQREAALPAIVLLMLLDWTGDFVDGTIAHRSLHPRRTRIGDSDIYIDLFVSICLGIFLVSAGFVGLTVGFWYAIGWIVLLWRFGLDRNLLMLAQTPIYLWFIIVAVHLIPEMGYWLVIWVAAALTINWRRFSKDIVPKFISGVRGLWDDHGKPHSS